MTGRQWSALILLVVAPALLAAQQVADTAFRWAPTQPRWPKGQGPVVLLDEAHHNFHTLDGRYQAFGRTLAADGFRVRPLRVPITARALEGTALLVIANALHERNRTDWSLPTPSAFTPDEIRAVQAWLQAGGALLLIADHMPFPGAADALASALGVRMLNGFAAPPGDVRGAITFRRGDGTLADHPVTRGRTPAERIDSVVSFTGQAFRIDGGDPLLALRDGVAVLLPDTAWRFSNATPRIEGGGMLQGAVRTVGTGRVAVFGEAAMFSAQRAGATAAPMGMNAPAAAQNPQFLLNLVRWLVERP